MYIYTCRHIKTSTIRMLTKYNYTWLFKLGPWAMIKKSTSQTSLIYGNLRQFIDFAFRSLCQDINLVSHWFYSILHNICASLLLQFEICAEETEERHTFTGFTASECHNKLLQTIKHIRWVHQSKHIHSPSHIYKSDFTKVVSCY